MFAILLATITFVTNPSDPSLKFDGYKVERNGSDYVITGSRARSEIYARYDEPLWKDLKVGETFVRNPVFETRFLNVNTTRMHGIKDYLAATGCNLVQLGRLYGVSFEETLPEVFAALPQEEQDRLRQAKRATRRSACAQVKELADLDVPAYPLLYGCDAMKWNKTLCEAFLKVHPSAKAVNPPQSWEKGILCPSDPETARFIEAFVYEVASNAPYEGIVATFWDDYGLNCHCDRCRKNGNDQFGNQVAFAVGCYERACAKAKRKLIVRTWASGAAHWLGDEWVHAPGYGGPTGEPLSVWGKAYANLRPEAVIQTKVYNADCQPNAPFSRLLGELNKMKPGNVEFAEWQITGQTLGKQWLPASVVDDTAWRMKEARRRVGSAGGVALYAGSYRNPGYDALDDVMNSLNLYAWRELSWNPEKPVTTICKEWSVRTFGKVEPHVIAAMRASERAVVASFSPLGLGAPTESNFAKNRARRESLLKYTNRYFLPEGEAALAPTRENIARVLAEKDDALAAVGVMRSELQQADLPTAQKDEMLLRTEWLRAHLTVSRALDGALWRLRYLETLSPTDKESEALRQAIASDYEVVRTHAGELFADAVGRTFSFYAEPVRERQVTLGSPIGLMRDIREQAMDKVAQAPADDGVRYRGIFINDEDWGLRPWAVKQFGKTEQIGTNAYEEVFRLMQADGLNLLWPAMHEGGYEFSSRPGNFALADKYGITIGTSHCEPMLRNNCYLPRADKAKWSWTNHPDFLKAYWTEGVRRGEGHRILWTIGMRGIHDGRMPDGKTTDEKKAILEEVFACQTNLLASTPRRAGAGTLPTLFCPYKEVLPIFNAGLKVPDGTVILWTNDNFGYIRRLGGPQVEGRPQGIYWHASYYGNPHSYTHLCTIPPAFMWYELCAKAWANGVRDVWMLNAGDVFPAEVLLDAYGRIAKDPDAWGANAQNDLLKQVVENGKLKIEDGELRRRIVRHLNEFYNLGFNRRPEHMCIQWTTNLPQTVKSDLLKRYKSLLAEDREIERQLSTSSLDLYFRLIGFQAQFLAHAGIIHLEGRDKAYARSVLDPLMARWDALEGGRWSGLWCDTIEEQTSTYQPTRENRWSSQMQWPWNEPEDPARKDRRGESRNDYVATAYAWERAKGLEEPTWIEPVARERGAKGGEWVNVAGLGTSGDALALLPVKPGVGEGALLKFDLNHLPTHSNTHPLNQSSLVLQFLPDFALWPGLKLGVKVSFDDGEAKYVEVPRSDSNIGEKDSIRAVAVQDNFIRVDVPIPSGAKTATITAVDPGVVIDRVGVRLTRQASGYGERIIPQGANVAPNGDRLDVTSKCLRLNGRALVPIMGEMHYSRIPRDEWAKSLATMREGGVSIVATYVFWNHHEWKEGEWDFSGDRDLSAFLGEVKKAGLWAVVRIGPWAHGECREGGFPDWLVDKAFEWANGDAKKARQMLRSRDARFLGETKKLFERVHSEVAPHLWKNGGPVIGIQLENESRGPWPYYQALKKLAVEAGYDVPMYTRTGWPRLNGPETTFGEMIPLYGDYAEGFWDRELKSMPGGYKAAFEMRPARTSSVIATEQLGEQKAEDAKGAEKYPYFTCELGGGMASSYHRRLVMEPMDAFALAVVKLGSGSNLPGFYMYHGGSNPTEYGVNMAESQRGRFTNYNDLPVVSYEFMAPISEFGEPQYAYWMIKALADFCRENAEELAVAEPVFVNKNETRRGRFSFHNDYVRRLKPDGECWIGVEKDGKVERILDGRVLSEAPQPCGPHCPCVRGENLVCDVSALRLVKPAGTPPPVRIGPNGVAMPPEESAWDAAAEYEVPFKAGDTMLEIAYDGDMARLYADGVLVQDDFWKGLPIRYALRRLPKGTKRLVLKVLPRGAGWEDKVYVDRAP